jgi:hypothetical protein
LVQVGVRRFAVILAALAGLLGGLGSAAYGASVDLVPRVKYQRAVETVRGQHVVVHVVTAPRPGGLYRLMPVLSSGTVLGRETVTSMQRALAKTATVVGVNGDYSSFVDGHPSGMLMTGGDLRARPFAARASLAIGSDGTLRAARVGFFGTWAIGDSPRTRLDQLNRALGKGEIGLFTRAWGPATPAGGATFDVLIENIDAALPNVDLSATVVSAADGGGTPIPPTGAVLQAKGSARAALRALAQPGAPAVVKLVLKPWWDDVTEAIGGGPTIVQDGRLTLPTTEGFTSSQLLARAPRTAVGQLPDGRIILVAVDGRQRSSAGMTMRDLGLELARRGAVTAMALDGGGSTTLAFEGSVLNAPSEGRERPIGDALMLLYYGVYARAPRFPVVSPNGDGVADLQQLSWKIVRNSTVSARLVGPGGKVAWASAGDVEPGTYSVPAAELAQLAEGRWQLTVESTDDQGMSSEADRAFSVDNTLGDLSLSAARLDLRPKRHASLSIRFRLAHAAQLRITVAHAGGAPLRTVYADHRAPGTPTVTWDGRDAHGKLAAAGRYVVRVEATNSLGKVALTGTVAVTRRRS